MIPRSASGANASPIQNEFFETKIRPVFVQHCYECHGPEKKKGGLRVDFRDGLLKGGESGPAIIPGDPQKSLLLKAIRQEDENLKMPEKGSKLDPEVIEAFATWIRMGAPDPRDNPSSIEADTGAAWAAKMRTRRQWWSFQPIQDPPVPPAKRAGDSSHPVDRFLQTKQEERGLAASPPADRRTSLRRLSYVLTGLPPSADSVQRFLDDTSPDAWRIVVDRLLASPRFGEHWARHWMDLVRFAETHGSEGDPEIPEAWRYRDYLIRAFNDDIPLNRIIQENIAGDLLPDPRWNQSERFNESALGAAQLRLVEHGFQPVDTLDEQMKVIENQIDVLGKAFQGLTLACARCHDHKFDPVSQRDFYALYGIFASCRPGLVTIDDPARLRVHREKLAELKKEIKASLVALWRPAAEGIRERLLATLPAQRQIAPAADDAFNDRIVASQKNVDNARRRARARFFESHFTNNVAGETSIPMAAWTFNGDARDLFGTVNGELVGEASIQDGRLILNGTNAFVRSGPLAREIGEKTLEAWVTLDDLDQQGGGVLTVETQNGAVFDSIVFAEQERGKWVAGSDNFTRTRPVEGPIEMSKSSVRIHLAIVYGPGDRIALFRNGQPYGAPYVPSGEKGRLRRYAGESSRVLLGLRHTGGGRAFLRGAIDEARLYDRALTGEEVARSYQAGALSLANGGLFSESADQEVAQNQAVLTALQQEFITRFPDFPRKRAAREQWMIALTKAEKDEGSLWFPWTRLREKSNQEFADEWRTLAGKWGDEVARRAAANRAAMKGGWDFSAGQSAAFRLGPNPPEAVLENDAFTIQPAGEKIVAGFLPRGIYSHLLSQKHNGVLMTPRFKVETDSISIYGLGGKGARIRLIPDNYAIGSEGIFPQREFPSDHPEWVRIDASYRKGVYAYLEFISAGDMLARNRPAAGDGRSFFGVQQVVFHNDTKPPQEEVLPISLLLSGAPPNSLEDLAGHYRDIARRAVDAWEKDELSAAQCALLDILVRNDLLPNAIAASRELESLVSAYRKLEAEIPIPRRAPGLLETAGADSPLLNRGDPAKPTAMVHRRFLEVFASEPFSTDLSGRLELSREIVDPRNPLTARVLVNRVWSHLFGRGLVSTVDNFGHMGEKPVHPELLDYLAARLTQARASSPDRPAGFGWSLKETIRFLVTTEAWQQSSAASSRARVADPENRLLSHMNVRRLEAESIRDALLMVSGRLDSTMYGPGDSALAPPGAQRRRSVYLTIRRNSLNPFLEAFDAPKPFTTLGRRETTNVPAQSLALLNDPFVLAAAKAWATTVLHREVTIEGRLAEMFLTAFGRPPTEVELDSSRRYLNSYDDGDGQNQALARNGKAWTALAQSLFNLKEFIYIR